MTKNNTNLTKDLRELDTIVEWFESQDEVDVEEALKRVKRGAELVKTSRSRLKEVENEFEEIKRGLQEEV